MSKLVQEKDEVKALIRGILTSSKELMTSKALFHDFKNMSGFEVPYRKFGFPNFEAYLRSIPDTVVLQPSGGPSYNVLLVSSEKSKHIDELVQRQKIGTKKRGSRKLRHNSYRPVTRAMTMAPSPSRPFIPQFLQKMISEFVANYPTGVELHKLESHIKFFKLEQYGGFQSLIRQLTHIVKEERGKAYPVNSEACKENLLPPKINSGLVSNTIPSGYENNSAHERDYWDDDYSSSGEDIETKTKLVNDQITKPASDKAYKQSTANFDKLALKQPAANNLNQSPFKQSTLNNVSEPEFKPHIASNCEPALTQSTADSYSKSTFEQSEVNSFSKPAFTSHTVNNFDFHEPDFRKPSTYNFTEPSFKLQTNKFHEPAIKQPKVQHLSDPAAFSTCMNLGRIEIPTMKDTMSASHISDRMKKNLQKLAEMYPEGIWCSQLPKLYQKHFGVDLNVQSLGFVSVVQFVADVPEVFQSIQTTEADWMVFDAKKGIPDHLKDFKEKIKRTPIPEHVIRNLKKLTLKFESGISIDTFAQEYLTAFGKQLDVSEWGFDSLQSFLMSLKDSVLVMECFGLQKIIYPKHGVEKELAKSPMIFSDMKDFLLEHYPSDVIGPKFIIPQQDLPAELKFCSIMEVLVAEVFTPSKFWLQIRGRNTSFALDKLMTDMQEFYNTEYNNELYKMKEPTYRELQYCVAPYSDEYHRALITRVFAEEVQVKFIDYGTIDIVKKQTLRYLHSDFASLPAQAIRAKLCNIQPVGGPNASWPRVACKRFLELVSEKPLIATVHMFDSQTKVIEVALVDTTGKDDVHINDILKAEGHAVFWKKKPNNLPAESEISSDYRQEVSYGRERVWRSSSSSSIESLAKNVNTGNDHNVKESTCTASTTSGQSKQSVDEEPIIISAERRRVLPPPGFNNQTGQQLPTLDSLALLNMALYQQALQQQQQQMLQNLMMVRHPELFMQGTSAFVSPYTAASTFPLIAFAPVMMPNIAQVPAGNPTIINTAMPNITQVPSANNTMINTVMPNTSQVSDTNTSTNVEVPTHRNTADSATMTTSEEETISELTENLNISDNNKDITKWTVDTNERFQNNNPVEEVVDLDEDFVFVSDSEEEEIHNSNELAFSHQESNVTENREVVTNNYENINVRQLQSVPEQHGRPIVKGATEISQRNNTSQIRSTLVAKVVEIAKRPAHVINIKGKPHMCTDELVHLFTNFSGRHVVLKILQSKNVEIPFKEIKKSENQRLFQILNYYNIKGVKKPIGHIQQELHMIPLANVNQFLELLNIKDPKILSGVHETLQSWETN